MGSTKGFALLAFVLFAFTLALFKPPAGVCQYGFACRCTREQQWRRRKWRSNRCAKKNRHRSESRSADRAHGAF